jgi:hypothetical protein
VADNEVVSRSQALAELERLLAAGFGIESIATQFRGDAANVSPCTTVQLAKDTRERTLESTDDDFVKYCFRFKVSLNREGKRVFRQFASQNRYWTEKEQLCRDPETKFAAVCERYKNGHLKLDYDPSALLLECLRSRNWGDSRFLPLKRDYYEIRLAILVGAQGLVASQRRLLESRPEARAYAKVIEQILDGAWQREATFIGRCVHFIEYSDLDIEAAILRAFGQAQHVHDLFGMLAPRTPMPARRALPHLLDGYRRYCEALRPFIRALGQAAQICEGRRPLEDNMRYQTIIERIASTRFAAVVDCLDPAIRNAEAHGGTDYDDANGRVLLTEPDPAGGRRIVRSYTYQQVSEMTLRLERGLFPAMLSAFAVHNAGVLAMVLHSSEYIDLLLSIDNLAD